MIGPASTGRARRDQKGVRMSASNQVYRDRDSIPVVFDTLDPRQLWIYEVLRSSFGYEHAVPEDLNPPHRCSLIQLPGGLREVQR